MASARSRDHLIETIAASPIPMVASNPMRSDNPLEIVNEAFCQLTGYSENDIVGRNCRFLTGEGTEPWLTEQIRTAVRKRVSTLVDILNYRADGVPFRNGVLVAPLFDDNGEVQWFLGSQVDLGPPGNQSLTARRMEAYKAIAGLPPRQRAAQQADRLAAQDQREDRQDASWPALAKTGPGHFGGGHSTRGRGRNLRHRRLAGMPRRYGLMAVWPLPGRHPNFHAMEQFRSA
jgi:PAS domain S-box-containing protein